MTSIDVRQRPAQRQPLQVATATLKSPHRVKRRHPRSVELLTAQLGRPRAGSQDPMSRGKSRRLPAGGDAKWMHKSPARRITLSLLHCRVGAEFPESLTVEAGCSQSFPGCRRCCPVPEWQGADVIHVLICSINIEKNSMKSLVS